MAKKNRGPLKATDAEQDQLGGIFTDPSLDCGDMAASAS